MHKSIRDIIREGNSDTADNRQKQEFFSLFHQVDTEFELKNQLLEELHQTEASDKGKHFFDSVFEQMWSKRSIEFHENRQKNQLVFRMMQLAAILVLGLILGYTLNSVRKAATPVYYTSLAPRGSVSEMYLPDGTHIFLNSGSEIKYSVDGAEHMREIFLSGEAWFQVAKNKEKPFLVHTSSYDVLVKGTSFNVKAYPDEKEVVTTLDEGCLQVRSTDELKLTEEPVLKPGEQLIYNKESKKMHIDEVNTRWYSSWKDNKLVFINMSLKDLGVLLERKFGVEIEITDQNILNYHYDGTIKDETIIEVLDILKHTLPIQYRIVGQKIIIQNKK